MAEQKAIQLSEEELKPIRELRLAYNNLMFQIGQAELQKHDLMNAVKEVQAAEDNLMGNYESSKATERQQLDELNKKYGIGVLNVESGLFTPSGNQPNDIQPVTEPVPTPPIKK